MLRGQWGFEQVVRGGLSNDSLRLAIRTGAGLRGENHDLALLRLDEVQSTV
jgi:hypothetical protein